MPYIYHMMKSTKEARHMMSLEELRDVADLKVSKNLWSAEKVVVHAMRLGMEVVDYGSGALVVVAQRHKGTKKILRGLLVYPNGYATDATVRLDIAKHTRNMRVMNSILGLY